MTNPTNGLAENSEIMDLLARETEMFVRQDFDGWAACWVQDARVCEVCVSSSLGTTVLEGWETLSRYIKNVMENGATCEMFDVQRLNVNATVSGNIAHVVYDEVSQHVNGRIENTFETRVLERTDGTWRILYSSFILRGHQQIDASRLAVDAKGEILCAPDEARKKLESHRGLQISGNRLRATRPSWDKILQAGLKCAAEQHGYFQHYRYMAESGRNFRLPVVLGETDEGSVVVCILFVRDGLTFVEAEHDGDVDARMSVARTIFGLSEGQMSLAHRIVAGDNLIAASEALGISKNTARTHLSRIYDKTGVNSQTALVRALLSVG
ncbi:MAG: nuclear transport factor 2 family protein [Paracoccaceae bacterium]